MKKILLSAACLAAFGAAPAVAQESPWDISGSVSIVSDYVFRGISQTGGDGALQAGVTIGHDSGFYFGVWGSNIDFSEFGDFESDFEIDYVIGYGGAIDDATTYDVSLSYYTYPNQPGGASYNYFEIGAGITHSVTEDFSVGVSIAISPDNFDETGTSVWLALNGTYAATEWLSVSANLGYQSYDDDFYSPSDYFYYDIGATLTYGILDLDLRYVGTDSDVYGKDKIVGSVTFNF